MKVKVLTLTTDGDNCPTSTDVYTDRGELDAALRDLLGEDPQPGEDLSEAWERVNDGACIIDEHTISLDVVPRSLLAGLLHVIRHTVAEEDYKHWPQIAAAQAAQKA